MTETTVSYTPEFEVDYLLGDSWQAVGEIRIRRVFAQKFEYPDAAFQMLLDGQIVRTAFAEYRRKP